WLNIKIRAGELHTTPDHKIQNPHNQSLNGSTGVVWNWWGVQIYLDEGWTQKLEGLLNVGAGGAALCAAFAWAPCAFISAALWMDAGEIQFFDNGSGVVLNFSWIGMWVDGQ